MMSLTFYITPSLSVFAIDARVENAVVWAINIANDNRHGYSSVIGQRTGPDYDCSSFVASAFHQAGFNVSADLGTSNMVSAFVNAGFTKYNRGAVELQRGDIMWKSSHTELYIGNNQCVGAHKNYDGVSGDTGSGAKAGKEIRVSTRGSGCTACSDYTLILRYDGNITPDPPTPTEINPDDYPEPTQDYSYSGSGTATYSEEIKWIQAVLYRLGYFTSTGSIDGKYGPGTRNAIISFQQNNGITQDSSGVCGYYTRQALKDAWNPTSVHYNPQGCVDMIEGYTGAIAITGWAFDRDNAAESLYLLVHIDDQYAGTVLANVSRTDVDDVYHVGEFHGFAANIQTDKTGYHEVKIYALNIGGGENVEIGHKTVNITPIDTTLPIISNVSVSDLTASGYTVTCTVTDDSGISSVSFPTWSAYNDKDDIIRREGTINGNTATFRVDTSEHNNEYGLYYTQINAVDIYNNSTNTRVDVYVPDSYVSSHYYNGHIYEVYDKPMTWSQAKSYCEERGGYLLAIEDADEQAFINQILSGRSIYAYAIGATDEETEGVWKWVNGKPVEYTNWNTDQPDNAGNEDNMWILADSSKDSFCKWNDYPGEDWSIGFICEIETESYTPTASVSCNGYTYELYNYNLTYDGAEEFCKSKGGHLASITKISEQAAVYQLLKKSDCPEYCWIGARRSDTGDSWIWEDGSDFSFTMWGEEQPDNYDNRENRIEIYKSTGMWNDVRSYACCDASTRRSCFVLKKEGTPICNHTITELKNIKAATCAEAGYTGDTYCLGCGAKLAEGEVVGALGHDFGEYESDGNATCTADGTKTAKCSRCDVTDTVDDVGSMLAHTVGEWIFDEVSHHRHCDMCDEDVDLGEHAYQLVVVTPATVDADGLKKEVCSICGYESGNTDVIPKLENHTPGDINGDGAVNNKDLTRLFQYLSDWDVEVDEAALDVNGDGSVNNKDLTRLFQYLSDWDVQIF